MKISRFVLGIFLLMLFFGCETPAEKATAVVNPDYEIASSEYSNLAVKALNHFTSFEFDSWESMLSEDVDFYFPDGDAGTRTILKGKTNVLNWWRDWKNTSGVQSMTYKNHVDMPINAKETMAYSGFTGVLVLSYFSNEIVFNEGTVNLRMNIVTHFNEDNLIDRYYTYYDRTKIVELMKKNILESEQHK